MISFNQEFKASYAPSTDTGIIAEFAQAHHLVRFFSPACEKVETCFANIRKSFSPTTWKKYGHAVRYFVREAKKELDVRAGLIATAAILGETKKRVARELEAPPTQRPKSLSPYFSNLLLFFSFHEYEARIFDEGRKIPWTEQNLHTYWERKLTTLRQLCETYKRRALKEGESYRDREIETTIALEEATALARKKIENTITTLRQCNEILSQVGIKWDSFTLSLEEMSAIITLRPEIEAFLKNPRKLSTSFNDACESFFRFGICEESLPEICRKKFSFFLKLLEFGARMESESQFYAEREFYNNLLLAFLRYRFSPSKESFVEGLERIAKEDEALFGSLSLYRSFLSRFISWTETSPAVQTEMRALSLASIHEKAHDECKKIVSYRAFTFLLALVQTPQRVEALLSHLSAKTKAQLEQETVRSDLEWMLAKSFDQNKDAAYSIEFSLIFMESLSKKGMSSEVIKQLSKHFLDDSGLFIGRVTNDILFYDACLNGETGLCALTKEELEEIAESEDVKHLLFRTRLIYFLSYNGSWDTFKKIDFLYGDGADFTLIGKSESEFPTTTAVAFFQSLSPEELEDCIFLCENGFVDAPLTTTDAATIRAYLKKKNLLDFLRRVYGEQYFISDKAPQAALDFFYWLQNPCDLKLHTTHPFFVHFVSDFLPGLTNRERQICYTFFSPEIRINLLYSAEASGRIERELSCLPLSLVSKELLLRFLGSKPFPRIKEWLHETIIGFGEKKCRLETLHPSQKKAILARFTQSESFLPLQEWMDLFQVREEEIKPPFPASPEYAGLPVPMRRIPFIAGLREVNRTLRKELDEHDPLSLFLAFKNFLRKGKLLTNNLPLILFSYGAREERICGGRTFLSWGDAPAESSPCCTQDDVPLHGTYKGNPITIYPRGLFNDITFGFASVTLRRKWYDLQRAPSPLLDSGEVRDLELWHELARLSKNLLERYPQLTALANGGETPELNAPIIVPDELAHEKTFASLFTKAYKILTRSYEEECERLGDKRPHYDCNNPVHRNAFMYLTLLNLLRHVNITHENDIFQITFSKNVFYRLRSLSREDFHVSPEDNPGIANLERYASDYPLHTLSPITPSDITPEHFVESAHQVQALSETDITALHDSVIPFLSKEIPDDVPYEKYFDLWRSLWPQGIKCDAARPVMVRLAKNYYGRVDDLFEVLEPSQRYLLDPRGVCRFTKEENVPEFLWPLGSFASALCRFFIPHDPLYHDGSCAINSFLLGLKGPLAYADRPHALAYDIQRFREDIVGYALDNMDALKDEFGERAMHQLVLNYGQNHGFESWTTPEVWAIAARKYGRIINVFSCNASDNYFRTNDRGEIVPFDEEHDIFRPSGDVTGESINLLFWGPHYCFLQKKK